MIGRLSGEKRQDLIIEAAKRSKYADRLQLVFAGKGPKEKAYRKLAAGLAHPPVFGFYGQDELRRLINMCDLYVHASDAEIEGTSCMRRWPAAGAGHLGFAAFRHRPVRAVRGEPVPCGRRG